MIDFGWLFPSLQKDQLFKISFFDIFTFLCSLKPKCHQERLMYWQLWLAKSQISLTIQDDGSILTFGPVLLFFSCVKHTFLQKRLIFGLFWPIFLLLIGPYKPLVQVAQLHSWFSQKMPLHIHIKSLKKSFVQNGSFWLFLSIFNAPTSSNFVVDSLYGAWWLATSQILGTSKKTDLDLEFGSFFFPFFWANLKIEKKTALF